MSKFMDLTGQRFGRLVVVKKVGKANSHGVLWLCQCDCGKAKETRSQYLISGGTSSCGCYRSEQEAKRASAMGENNVKHGMCRRSGHHPLFDVWCGMRGRCKYPSHISYKNYGAKGIGVCAEWEDFHTFYEWAMSHGYQKGLVLDRIDPTGNYCPENCRFITQAENNRWKRDIIWIEYNGVSKTLMDWSRELGISPHTIRYRLHRGLSADEVLDPHKRPNNVRGKAGK